MMSFKGLKASLMQLICSVTCRLSVGSLGQVGVVRSHALTYGKSRHCKEQLAEKLYPKFFLDSIRCVVG